MAARQWTDEQRKAQAEKIRQHKNMATINQQNTGEGKKKCSQKCTKDWRVHHQTR